CMAATRSRRTSDSGTAPHREWTPTGSLFSSSEVRSSEPVDPEDDHQPHQQLQEKPGDLEHEIEADHHQCDAQPAHATPPVQMDGSKLSPLSSRLHQDAAASSNTRLQQVVAPSAFCSSVTSTVTTSNPASRIRCAVRGKQAGITATSPMRRILAACSSPGSTSMMP